MRIESSKLLLSLGLVFVVCGFVSGGDPNATCTRPPEHPAGGNSPGPCVFPFQYFGVNYTGCAMIDSGEPWCSTTANYDVDSLWIICDTPCLQVMDCGPLGLAEPFTVLGCSGTTVGAECNVTCTNTSSHAYIGTHYRCDRAGLWVGMAACFKRSQTHLHATQLSSSPGVELLVYTEDGPGAPGTVATGSISFSTSFIPPGLSISGPPEVFSRAVSRYRLFTGVLLGVENFTLDETRVTWHMSRVNKTIETLLPAATVIVSPALQLGKDGALAIRGLYFETRPQTITGGLKPLEYTLFGTLPAGLNLTVTHDIVEILGYPLVSGNFSNIVVEAQDRNGARVRLNALDLAIGEPMLLHWQPPAPALAAAAGRALVLALPPFTRTGGLGPLTLRIDGLPSGLRFNARTEEIVGSTSMPGAFNLTVWGTDSTGIGLRVGTLLLTITQAGAAEESLLASGAGIGVMAGCGVLLLGMAFWLHAHLTRNALKRHDFARELAQIQRQQGLLQMLKTPREVKRECIKLLDMLGKGHFGQVYKGTVQEKSNPEYLVAVKTLVTDASEEHQRDLLYEAALMAQLEHDNVVSLVAVCTLAPQPLLLLQFCEHGSLLSFLQRRTGFDSLTLSARLSVALDCARGMRYLHSLDIVHRDLAARNVLVASDYTCKISDFGLSRELNDRDYYKLAFSACLPIRWSAPEVLEDGRYNHMSDVWSFGILLHEVFANGESPYKNMSNEQVIVRVKAGYRLGRARECPDSLYALQRRCWDQDPKARPDFTALSAALLAMSQSDASTEQDSNSERDSSTKPSASHIYQQRLLTFASRSVPASAVESDTRSRTQTAGPDIRAPRRPSTSSGGMNSDYQYGFLQPPARGSPQRSVRLTSQYDRYGVIKAAASAGNPDATQRTSSLPTTPTLTTEILPLSSARPPLFLPVNMRQFAIPTSVPSSPLGHLSSSMHAARASRRGRPRAQSDLPVYQADHYQPRSGLCLPLNAPPANRSSDMQSQRNPQGLAGNSEEQSVELTPAHDLPSHEQDESNIISISDNVEEGAESINCREK
eukprot:m.203390 g.203390  ORF g.203390 m.203390 type:complete len:1050 (-) comp15520_c0_seq9:36-3185(-)